MEDGGPGLGVVEGHADGIAACTDVGAEEVRTNNTVGAIASGDEHVYASQIAGLIGVVVGVEQAVNDAAADRSGGHKSDAFGGEEGRVKDTTVGFIFAGGGCCDRADTAGRGGEIRVVHRIVAGDSRNRGDDIADIGAREGAVEDTVGVDRAGRDIAEVADQIAIAVRGEDRLVDAVVAIRVGAGGVDGADVVGREEDAVVDGIRAYSRSGRGDGADVAAGGGEIAVVDGIVAVDPEHGDIDVADIDTFEGAAIDAVAVVGGDGDAAQGEVAVQVAIGVGDEARTGDTVAAVNRDGDRADVAGGGER